jgi:hypothetical protein
MRNACVITLLFTLLLTSACPKSSGPPSEDYQKARTIWLELLKDKRDNASSDPAAQDVLALLQKVDPTSIDGPAAANLKAQIEQGISEAKARQSDLDKEQDQARQAAQAVGPGTTFGPSRYGTGETQAVADGGVAAAGGEDSPKVGMTTAEFEGKFGRCFEMKNEAAIGGKLGGQVWGLKDLGLCRERFKDFLTHSVVLVDGKVDSIRSNEEVAPKKYKIVDGKVVAAEEKDLKPEPPKEPPKPPQAPEIPGVVQQPEAPVMPPTEIPATTLPVSNQP